MRYKAGDQAFFPEWDTVVTIAEIRMSAYTRKQSYTIQAIDGITTRTRTLVYDSDLCSLDHVDSGIMTEIAAIDRRKQEILDRLHAQGYTDDQIAAAMDAVRAQEGQ